jgi:hypothetical protein
MNDKQSVLFPGSNPRALRATTDALTVLQGLDRSEVEPLAAKILETIGTFCVRVEVAGSFRRGGFGFAVCSAE